MAPIYPNAHIYLRAGGHFGDSGIIRDTWSIGLRFGVVGDDVPYNETGLQTFIDAALPLFNTFHAVANNGVGNNCFFDWVSGARIGTNGKYDPLTQLTKRKDNVSPVLGGGTPSLPWNSAGVISLRTTYPRGYASNGRVYYPLTSAGLTTTTGRIPSIVVNSRVSSFKTLLDGLNVAAAAYQVNMRAVVVSGVPPGLQAKVSSIRSDERLDSIESRENDQPVTYVTATIAP